MISIDGQIAAVRRAYSDCTERGEISGQPENRQYWATQATALRAVLTGLEAQKAQGENQCDHTSVGASDAGSHAATVGNPSTTPITVQNAADGPTTKPPAQTADDEREARTRLLGIRARDEMCEIDAGNVGEQACKIDRRELLRQFDAARLALTAARAELAQAREQLDEQDELRKERDEAVEALDLRQNSLAELHAELARLKSPPGADAMEIAKTIRDEMREACGVYHTGATGKIARAIEAAEARGRKAVIEMLRSHEAAEILARALCDYHVGPNSIWESPITNRVGRIEHAHAALCALASQPPSALK